MSNYIKVIVIVLIFVAASAVESKAEPYGRGDHSSRTEFYRNQNAQYRREQSPGYGSSQNNQYQQQNNQNRNWGQRANQRQQQQPQQWGKYQNVY